MVRAKPAVKVKPHPILVAVLRHKDAVDPSFRFDEKRRLGLLRKVRVVIKALPFVYLNEGNGWDIPRGRRNIASNICPWPPKNPAGRTKRKAFHRQRKRITQRLNPRVCRVAALPAPNNRERTQWYFQRYAAHLPAAGEMVLFDRSWYNRGGVERVMGFCTDDQYEEFFRSVPEFEKMLIRSGIQLIKYWFSITDDEQEFRFTCRVHDPLKQWKLSPMDLESRRRWEDYTTAKEIMFERTHTAEAPWWVVHAVDKKKARLNCIHHLLSQVPYQEVVREPIVLPTRVHNEDYHRQPVPAEMMVPSVY